LESLDRFLFQELEKALAQAELAALTWHDLRHIAASMLTAESASVAYISRVLGHTNPSITGDQVMSSVPERTTNRPHG